MTQPVNHPAEKIHSQILIIGGGPAGSAAAISALNSGAGDVLILEREPENRHRIGEILLTQTILEFKNLGIDVEMREFADKFEWARKYAAAYVHGSNRDPWIVQNNHPLSSSEDQPHIPRSFVNEDTGLWFTLMVRRHEFDTALREIAVRRGAKVLVASAQSFKMAGEERAVEGRSAILSVDASDESGKTYRLTAEQYLDCTGQRALVPRGMKTREAVGDWGLRSQYTYYTGVDFPAAQKKGFFKEGANILSYEDGWVWIANLGKGLVSCGVVSRHWPDGVGFFEKIKGLPEYTLFGFDKAKLCDCFGAEVDKPVIYSHPDYRWRSKVFRGSNWMCAGDSAMFLDPLLSQGVTLALFFGSKAGEAAWKAASGQESAEAMYASIEDAYLKEIETLNKVVSLWYREDFTFQKDWEDVARKFGRLFGREIGDDVESFRFVSNLENVHYLFNERGIEGFLEDIKDFNTIKSILEFEKNELLSA